MTIVSLGTVSPSADKYINHTLPNSDISNMVFTSLSHIVQYCFMIYDFIFSSYFTALLCF